MATKAYDEVLVELLLTVQAERVVQRVYHIEQYQLLETLTGYPCIVYELVEDTPCLELADDSGYAWATYTVSIISPDSDDVRMCASHTKMMNDGAFNVMLSDTYQNIDWISVTSDVESSEFAIEQQEKGLKIATLTVQINHWGHT